MKAFTTILVAAGLSATLSTLAAQKLPDGKGKETVEMACTDCHGIDLIEGREWSADTWRSVVKSMVAKGASLNDDEVKVVVDYLAANYGEKPAKPAAKPAPKK